MRAEAYFFATTFMRLLPKIYNYKTIKRKLVLPDDFARRWSARSEFSCVPWRSRRRKRRLLLRRQWRRTDKDPGATRNTAASTMEAASEAEQLQRRRRRCWDLILLLGPSAVWPAVAQAQDFTALVQKMMLIKITTPAAIKPFELLATRILHGFAIQRRKRAKTLFSDVAHKQNYRIVTYMCAT